MELLIYSADKFPLNIKRLKIASVHATTTTTKACPFLFVNIGRIRDLIIITCICKSVYSQLAINSMSTDFMFYSSS